ncbi:MAG: sigma-70 family RNA polymerase sigma factor [Saprospiraceae bacterium]|nr:sigma-70 family RNA polymerase sigma factor [Saprospiraceae bacterium]MCB0623334.1 sigma-70 family RNA polymerase sigma factor [Saprospiraceae bacterium]MCB0676986.1 sigma-70 family RNA polymerase sigma factor [Saprospiraceae bacterium]
MTERDLIQGCIDEDRQCQIEVFRLYAGKMLAVCQRYARHHMEAEDILQEAFIKVYDNVAKFQFKGSFEGWIRRIVINTALKNYQKSSFQKERIGLEDYDDRPIEPEAISLLQEEELLDLIEQLPDGYRVVFNLYAVEGYSHKEIAEMLGIGESTSRSQLVKARKMLKDRILKLQMIVL